MRDLVLTDARGHNRYTCPRCCPRIPSVPAGVEAVGTSGARVGT